MKSCLESVPGRAEAGESALICIVVLNWNGRDDTLECLQSLRNLDYPNFRVLVVDNGSSDDSVAAIRGAYPAVEVLETGENLGFAGGNNSGIRRALELGAQYVLLLNNDTTVDPGMLHAFLEAAQQFPHAGAFSGKIYYYDDPNRIWYAGAKWDPQNLRFVQLGEGLDDGRGEFTVVKQTDYACGCAFFVSAARLTEVGVLDDDYFLFFEETDWCYRARKLGHPSIFVPQARLWHKVSVSFGGEHSPLALYFITRNRLLWASRHTSLGRRLRLYVQTLWSLARRFVPSLRRPSRWSSKELWWRFRAPFRDARNRAYFFGFRDFCLGRFGNCPERVRGLARQWSEGRLRQRSDSSLLHDALRKPG